MSSFTETIPQQKRIATPKPLYANIPPQIIPQKNLISQNTLKKSNTQENIFPKTTIEFYPNKKNLIKGFDPLKHVPPKYDIYGYLKPIDKRREDMSILNEKDKIRIPWCEKNSNKSGAMTQTELLQKRRKERVPDISYDLDQDGYVGGRDFVIAKRYDVDNDGKLNEQEKKNAYEGLANKIEENYVWNIDKQGGCRPLRLLQKRGQFIDAEDFLPIRDTYPKHPLSNVIPKCKTYTELKNIRKNENIKNINEKMSNWEKNHPARFFRAEINDTNEKNNNPKYTSVEQIKKDKNMEARKKCGLNPETTDNRNNTINAPTLKYVYNPKHKTKLEIDNDFHKENFEEAKKLSMVNHKNNIERLNEREDEIFSALYSEEERKTYTTVVEKKKKETNDFNIKTFSKQHLGVHGHELPKFSENKTMSEFWKHKDGYVEKPSIQSQREYLEKIKYYKHQDEDLYLNEKRAESPKWVDPFKKEHFALPKKQKSYYDDIITNLNDINIFNNFDPNVIKDVDYSQKKKHVYRWTTLVDKFAPNKFKKGRFFDALPDSKSGKDKKEVSAVIKEGIFLSDYMKNQNIKKMSKTTIKQKENTNVQNNENNTKPIKDFLFQKYSSKDQGKNMPGNKNVTARTKGF